MQMCMHGGRRDKRTDLLAGSKVDFSSLAIMCDGSHEHLPWTYNRNEHGFATAKERNYPRLFCQRIATLMAKHVGVDPPSRVPQKDKVAAGVQPRRLAPKVVQEYKQVLALRYVTSEEMVPISKAFERKVQQYIRGDHVPADAKLLSVVPEVGWGNGLSSIRIGIQWTYSEFLDQALSIRHPFDEVQKVPVTVARVIYNWAMLGPTAIEQKRKVQFQIFEKWA